MSGLCNLRHEALWGLPVRYARTSLCGLFHGAFCSDDVELERI
jgi:hypothetical protein